MRTSLDPPTDKVTVRAGPLDRRRREGMFKLDRVRPAVAADGLAELQVRWPNVPIVFCETPPLAEEWTYRFLAAAQAWHDTEGAVLQHLSVVTVAVTEPVEGAGEPTTAQVRLWARGAGLAVPDRGRLRTEIWSDWHEANPVQ